MRHALRAALAAPSTGQLLDLGLHQLAHDQRDRVSEQVAVLASHRSRDNIGRGHHPVLGHRGAPCFIELREEIDELGRHGGRNSQPDARGASYTTSTDVTGCRSFVRWPVLSWSQLVAGILVSPDGLSRA